MSDLATKPQEYVCGSAGPDVADQLLITARKVWLGKTTQVARALPDRQIRMIGAWCFLDHYGPEDIHNSAGMQVWAHPHTGLQTVSWLLDGEIEHRDSVGSHVMVRPGELHLMTAGHGIVHSELSLPDHPPTLHGLQLWVALPESERDGAPRFDSFPDLPGFSRPGVRGTVLVGELAGTRSPAPTATPLCAAQLDVEPGAELRLPLRADFEHGVFVVSGAVEVDGTVAEVDQLVYRAEGADEIRLSSGGGAQVLVLGGQPFEEEIVMWWNFVGRSHDEVVGFRQAWADRAVRFPPVRERGEKVMEAPPMPTVALKPRPHRRP